MQFRQQTEDHFAGPEIEVAGGFIGQQDGGLPTNARASTTRCCSPPDNSPARCEARVCSPTSSNLASDSEAAFRYADAPDQQRHHHVFLRRKLGQEVVNLPDEPNFPITKIRLFRVRES